MIFSIVIPAYNEEDAVVDILRRSLAAAAKLKAAGLGLDEVEVILVNDGSRDKTAERARSVRGAKVVDHPVNKGYGAAIKTGFAAARGEWLGFLDSDGTCDPLFFIDLLTLADKDGLDVAVGSRMHPSSRMPRVRIVGNWLFRTLVNLIGGTNLTDVASGMRVMKASALKRLAPLPNGMNFTPAMSVRAALDSRLKMGEIFMPYEERVGRSKLSVIRDGFRFLGIILDTAVTFRPLMFFGTAAGVLFFIAAWSLCSRWTASSAPIPFYLENHRVEDWMIFRVIFATVLLSSAAFLTALGATAQSLVAIINEDDKPTSGRRLVDAVLTYNFLPWSAFCFAAALVLNRRLLASYFETGHIPTDYWVFPLVGSLLALTGVEFLAFGLMSRITRLLAERRRWS
jgi:glycosyltransferase involved in cell wall biosynthesis